MARPVGSKNITTDAGREAAFWAMVSPEPTSGCFLWTGCLSGVGYGQFFDGQKLQNAHRWILERTTGTEQGTRTYACHRCDNRACVNPAHLFWGDHKANQSDAARKGKFARKLSPDAIREIVRLDRSGIPRRQIALRFGVDPTLVTNIMRGRIWRHVTDVEVRP